MLLIGDQREATEHMQQLKKDEEKITNNFTYGNYYGFFPEISRQGEQSWESQVQIPQAKGFGARK
jgi:beta-mannosidase